MRSLKRRSTYLECFIDYITLPTYVNARSLDIIMDMIIPRSAKEGTRRRISTNSEPNNDVWKRFLSNGGNRKV